MKRHAHWMAAAGALFFSLPASLHAQADAYFEIRVVDETGEPAPCVTLRTVNQIAFVTDDQGRVAFSEPGLMDTEVFFSVSGGGVERDADWLGFRGAKFAIAAGATGTITVKRVSAPGCEAGDVESRKLARGVLSPAELMRVDVLDDESGRGVPLVELTIAGRRWVTDSAGVVAIDPIELEGAGLSEVTLRSHGYSFADAETIEISAGGHATFKAHRENVAERLYRVTGGGIYRDSVLLGLSTPLANPTLNGQVLGQDSVFSVVFRDKLFFLWGDTGRPSYPLGNFFASGTAALPANGGLDPSDGIDLEYFVEPESGFSRPMAPATRVSNEASDGRTGVTWLGTPVVVPDASGVERLHATFGVFGSGFELFRYGMLAYDETDNVFVDALEYTRDRAYYPREGAYIWAHEGDRYVYTHDPIRMPALSEAVVDESTYEAFTPIVAGEVVRDDEGAAVYAWRKGERRVTPKDAAVVALPQRLFGHAVDVESGAQIWEHDNGSTEINEHTGRFLRLLMPGALGRMGETWLALADTPMGPWVAAQQVVNHDRYTFYNPRQHRALDEAFGRRVYFEGTYTQSFSGAKEPTPRYDYNQVMYRLDLDAPELAVPVPVYFSERGELGDHSVLRPGDAPIVASFLAPQAPRPGTVAVSWSGPDCEARRLIVGTESPTPPLFFALPADHEPETHQQYLYEYDAKNGESPSYGLEELPGARAVAVVWRNPVQVALPVSDYLPPFRADAGADRCVPEGSELSLAEGQWMLDGEPVTSGDVASAGLHVVERSETRADGFERRDTFLLRVGKSPPLLPSESGCGCGMDSPPAALGLVLLALLAAARRRY